MREREEGGEGGGGGTWGRGNLQCERPVRLGESANYVRARGGEDVVNCIDRRDDAAAAAGGGVAGLPGDDVACFFRVEGLEWHVIMWIEDGVMQN